MKTIVVLSGKGGVGKSSITASLAVVLSKENNIVCADCDVDASNLSLLFSIEPDKYEEWNKLSTNQTAIIDKTKCIKCNKCVESCYFNAIKIKDSFPKVSDFGCEGCGVCEIVCPVKAITLKDISNADIGYAKTKYGFNIASAQLRPGNSGSGKVVFEVRKKAKDISSDANIMLIDAAAGIGCPVIASVTGCDYALIVTEPTPSGYEDMLRAIDIVNHFRIDKGIIINKFDLNEKYCQKIKQFAEKNKTNIIEQIPFDKNFPKAMTKQIPIIEFDEKYMAVFENIKNELKKVI